MIDAAALVVMGPAGAGKTTVGEALAEALGWDFVEGDELHPAANVAKMAAGHPLDDADREPWLDAIAGAIAQNLGEGQGTVAACSALKRCYRDRLRAAVPGLGFVFLQLGADALARRLQRREGHFMPPSLLASQLATLEPPGADERVITVDGTLPPDAIVARVLG